MSRLLGFQSTVDLRNRIVTAANNYEVRRIVLNIDSPGGTAIGVQEVFATIRQVKSRKPVLASINGVAASAAYWIAAAATKVYASPSSMVGGVGAVCVHRESSKADEQAGIKYTFIQAGRFKADGNDRMPLSDQARATLQERVDDFRFPVRLRCCIRQKHYRVSRPPLIRRRQNVHRERGTATRNDRRGQDARANHPKELTMSTGRLNIRFTGETTRLNAQIRRLQNQVDRLNTKLRKTGEASSRSTKAQESGMLGWAKGVTSVGVAYAGLNRLMSTGNQLLSDRLTLQKKQLSGRCQSR